MWGYTVSSFVALNLPCLTWISIPNSVLCSPITSLAPHSSGRRGMEGGAAEKRGCMFSIGLDAWELVVVVNSAACVRHLTSKQVDPQWDATGYEFKHDYTIIESPRAVVFPVDNNDQKITRFNEIYKFSDGTLTRILEALDYRVKEFKVKRLNPSMNTRFWTQKDVTRRKEFIAAIERRLKTRRIFWNLECFVGGRVRDIDYRLL
ncbi:hypothetical protein Tco_0962583 [Tanacetum coccineum]